MGGLLHGKSIHRKLRTIWRSTQARSTSLAKRSSIMLSPKFANKSSDVFVDFQILRQVLSLVDGVDNYIYHVISSK